MLVLTRRTGETLEIRHGDETLVLHLRIRGEQVRLGFEGSTAFTIVRSELLCKVPPVKTQQERRERKKRVKQRMPSADQRDAAVFRNSSGDY